MRQNTFVVPISNNQGMTIFNLPGGVSHEGTDDDGNDVLRVTVPSDDDGFFGRQCPSCDQQFRIADDDYEKLPDDAQLFCAYCGFQDEHSEFLTDQQEDRVMRAAGQFAEQYVGGLLDEMLTDVARRSRGVMSYRSKPFFPDSLPELDEERLIRARACPTCQTNYAVFGEHRFCPVCGPLPPLAVAEDSIAAEVKRLDLLSDLNTDDRGALKEAGVLDRTYADAIKNVVAIVETLADSVFRSQVPNADDLLKGRGNVFQRLEDTAKLFLLELNIDIKAAVGAAWPPLKEQWATRHVLVHNDGVVDSKYLASVSDSGFAEGQRLVVTERRARDALAATRGLCRAIAGK